MQVEPGETDVVGRRHQHPVVGHGLQNRGATLLESLELPGCRGGFELHNDVRAHGVATLDVDVAQPVRPRWTSRVARFEPQVGLAGDGGRQEDESKQWSEIS